MLISVHVSPHKCVNGKLWRLIMIVINNYLHGPSHAWVSVDVTPDVSLSVVLVLHGSHSLVTMSVVDGPVPPWRHLMTPTQGGAYRVAQPRFNIRAVCIMSGMIKTEQKREIQNNAWLLIWKRQLREPYNTLNRQTNIVHYGYTIPTGIYCGPE